MQEIEGKEHEPVRRRVDGRSEGIEVGDAVLVLDHHLAIDQGGLAGQPGAGLDHPPIGARPVIAVAGEGADLAAIDDDQGAIAVILDLVNPALPGRRLRDEGREFRLDEAERGHIRLYVAGALAVGKAAQCSVPAPKRLHPEHKRFMEQAAIGCVTVVAFYGLDRNRRSRRGL